MGAYLPIPFLIVPVALWAALGLALFGLGERIPSALVLRLSALFVALWALCATTLAVGILALGGWPAIRALVADPGLLLAPAHAALWAYGALGAFLVLLAAFWLNQLIGRGLLTLLDHRPMPWPAGLEPPRGRSSLRIFRSERWEAFSFTILELPTAGRHGFPRHEVIFLSERMVAALSPEELKAVVAHELGHIHDLDGRYLTFLRTLARMMRWDPVLAALAWHLTRHEEYRADRIAAAATGRPRILARVLFKLLLAHRQGDTRPRFLATGFAGTGGPRETVRRIERLLAMADESGEEPADPA